MRLPLPTRRSTIRLAQALARELRAGDLVVLTGGLGAGKTFLVRALLRALGVPEEIAVPSPTFTLMNEYGADTGARVPVIHADLYRLLGATELDDELSELGLRARRADGFAVLVEWGQDAFEPLGADGLSVAIAPPEAEHARSATLEGRGPRGQALERALQELLSART